MNLFEWLSALVKQFLSYASSLPEKAPVKPPPPVNNVVTSPSTPTPPPVIVGDVGDVGDLKSLTKGTYPWYRKAFEICKIDQGYEAAVRSAVNTVLAGKLKYLQVERETGVPWYVIGGIHYKESSCSWSACLHNGEHIIGTGRKTTIVPIGRGPFDTWLEAAIDAMKGESLGKIKDWELGQMLMACEKYNGWGYQTGAGRAENSPYLWSRSNINDDKGRYVADGKFDPESGTNKTTGLAVILKELEKMGEIKIKRA